MTWAAPAGVSGITGYKILRTHYGHPVISARNPNTDYSRYAYDIATVGAGTTSYVHTPLRPGGSGHKFTYYVAAITADGDGFPASGESGGRRPDSLELKGQQDDGTRRSLPAPCAIGSNSSRSPPALDDPPALQDVRPALEAGRTSRRVDGGSRTGKEPACRRPFHHRPADPRALGPTSGASHRFS